MKTNLETIIKQYENRKCFESDFLIESKARNAYSGEEGPLKRLIEHLENNYPEQLDFISNLKKYLPAESDFTQTLDPAKETNNESELKPEKEETQMLSSEQPNNKLTPVPEVANELVKNNSTSSPVRQYQPGMEYFIEPDEEVVSHPAANTMPMMSNSEFFGLVKDVKDNGQIVPILTKDGKVVDGRNRLKACRLLAIPAKTQEIPENTDVAKLVVALNEQRRHLSTSQKAACAVLYMEVTKVSGGRSRKIAGNIFKVGESSVQKAKKIKEINKELFCKVHCGEVSLQVAMWKITPPKEEIHSGYSYNEACIKLSKYFIKDKVDELSDLADKCSGNLKIILKTLLKYISDDITTQKIIPMLQDNNDSGSILDCELGVAK